jgi:hypothetical protein
MKKNRSIHRQHYRFGYRYVPIICLIFMSVNLFCTSGGFDIAGGASDIGNSQGYQSSMEPEPESDTTAADSSYLIIDIVNGTIYKADEAPPLR